MYDVVIIGEGPAGLTSAIYCARFCLKSLVLSDINCLPQLLFTERVENYPGFPEGITARQLWNKFKKQAQNLGVNFSQEKVRKIEKKGELWKVIADKKTYESISVIVASGARPKRLNVQGEEEFLGKGVSFCAICDAPFFKNKEVVVIGGGDTAIQEALYLAKFVKKLVLVHRRGSLRATKLLQQKLFSLPRVNIEWNSILNKIEGKEKVERVKILNVKTNVEKEIYCAGVFIFVGVTPNTEFLEGVVDLNSNGFIMVNKEMKTSQEGIFACGDCTDVILKQIVTSVGNAALASYSAKNYIEKFKRIEYK